MHASFPYFNEDIQSILKLGAKNADIPQMVEKLGGPIIAQGIATIVELGFVYVMRDAIVDSEHAKKAMKFFNDNFVIRDPYAEGGERYYQGKFLLRTQKPGDNMNVYLQFCKNPDELFCETPFGTSLDPFNIVDSRFVGESEAERIEHDPSRVDLVIQFKDLSSVINLVGREQVDIVGLLLENVVQLTGNVGHLFKLGAIAKDIEMELGLTTPTSH